MTISAATGNSFYVATTGSDSAAGTFSRSLEDHRTRRSCQQRGVKAGDTVYVRGGILKCGGIRHLGLGCGGAISSKLSRRERDYRGAGIAALSNPHGLIHIDSRSYLTISGFEIRDYQTSSSALIPAGIWITGTAGNIQILNNNVHDIERIQKQTDKPTESQSMAPPARRLTP